MIRVNANLFRIAAMCQSNEGTRYYLRGVSIEPHAVKGAVMVTTDGHRLLAIHDESGFADETAIIALTPAALKECKPGKHWQRFLTVDGVNATINDGVVTKEGEIELGDAVAVSVKCRIDDTFPDWRRVVPQQPMILQPDEPFPAFNGVYLADMGKIAGELEKHFDRFVKHAGHAITATLACEALSPALVLFNKVPEAFGVLLPVRAADRGETPRNQVPLWLNAVVAATLQAAE